MRCSCWVRCSPEVSHRTLPKEMFVKFEARIGQIKNMGEAKLLISTLSNECSNRLTELREQSHISQLPDVLNREFERLEQFVSSTEHFLSSVEDQEWIFEIQNDFLEDIRVSKLYFSPIYARLFCEKMLWSRAEYFILSSATFLDSEIFLHETGLDAQFLSDQICHIKVPSSFPVENRPILNYTCGRLTYDQKAVVMPQAVKMLERIIDLEVGNNVAVHCHSYATSWSICNLIDKKYLPVLMTHTSQNEQEILDVCRLDLGPLLLRQAR